MDRRLFDLPIVRGEFFAVQSYHRAVHFLDMWRVHFKAFLRPDECFELVVVDRVQRQPLGELEPTFRRRYMSARAEHFAVYCNPGNVLKTIQNVFDRVPGIGTINIFVAVLGIVRK